MRNATSIGLFGASALALTMGASFLGACGGGGSGGDSSTAGTTSTTAGNSTGGTTGGTPAAGGNSSAGSGTGGASGGVPACAMTPGPKSGDGMNTDIDNLDDMDTMFAPAGTGSGSWDLSKDVAGMGMLTPSGTMTLKPVTGGQMGNGLHITGTGLTGWGASLAAFLNGPTGAFDASKYGGVAFYMKGTTNVQEGMNKLMIQARMPDVLPGPGSCCSDSVKGSECYSGHRVVIDVPADWKEVKIAWADFKGPTWGLGASIPFNPNRIRDINFSFNHDTAAMTMNPISFDIWVDGVRFLKMDEMGNVTGGNTGGAGGMGGGGAAGAGGAGGGGAGGLGGAGGGGNGGMGGM